MEKGERKGSIHIFVQNCMIFKSFEFCMIFMIFKSLFFGKLISSIVPIHENLKDREKCFFHSVVSAHLPFTVFFQGGFYCTDKENLVYLFDTIEGKTKTNLDYLTVKFSKQNKI